MTIIFILVQHLHGIYTGVQVYCMVLFVDYRKKQVKY